MATATQAVSWNELRGELDSRRCDEQLSAHRARRREKIFAVRTEAGPVVKRLQRDEDGWRLVSDNKAYKPIPWTRDAEVLGQVMWTGRTL